MVTLKAYAKRYGVDKYTAYEDLAALGFPLGQREAHWAQRPPPTPRRREPAPSIGSGIEWIRYGDEIMLVMGYTPGGAPYGYVQSVGEFEDMSLSLNFHLFRTICGSTHPHAHPVREQEPRVLKAIANATGLCPARC